MFSRRTFLKGCLGGSLFPWLHSCQEPDQELGQRTPFPNLPYVQNITPTGVDILWESIDSVVGRVEVFQDNTPVTIFGEELGESEFHRVPISGLEPGQTYFYQVKEEFDSIGPIRSFKTAPERGNTDAFSFVVISDSGEGKEEQLKIADHMVLRFPDFMLHAGDVVYDGFLKEYEDKYFFPYRALIHRVPVYPVLGDHDWDPEENGENGHAFFKYFSLPGKSPDDRDSRYSFTYGNALFVMLDTILAQKQILPLPDQIDFLKAELTANADLPWKFVVTHSPLFTNGEDRDGYDELRDLLLPVAKDYGVTATFSGDTHAYERFSQDGTYYFVNGGGGADLRELGTDLPFDAQKKDYHYLHVQIDDNVMQVDVYDVDNNLIDSVTETQ